MRPILAALLFLAAEPAPTHPALRSTLLEMMREDQESGRAVMNSRPGQSGDEAVRERSKKAHAKNAALIRAIVAEVGWPGRSMVGEDGARAAWLIVQHSDEDPAFQRRCLERMAAMPNEVDREDYAYLTDRVLTNEGKPQLYGTQGNGGATSPDERKRIDVNRKAVGLPAIRW